MFFASSLVTFIALLSRSRRRKYFSVREVSRFAFRQPFTALGKGIAASESYCGLPAGGIGVQVSNVQKFETFSRLKPFQRFKRDPISAGFLSEFFSKFLMSFSV